MVQETTAAETPAVQEANAAINAEPETMPTLVGTQDVAKQAKPVEQPASVNDVVASVPSFTDQELLAAIAAKPGEKVTVAQMQQRLTQVAFQKIGSTGTLCLLTLDNGFKVHGFSACVDPANYDEKIGQKIAYDEAFGKLWPLFGFLLAEVRHLRQTVGDVR